MSGRLIVLEGLDGSGKATQTALLAQALMARGVQVCTISFPDYESDSSALIKMYLSGAFADSASEVNAYAASCFYMVDRYASYCMKWGSAYQSGSVILADRYTTSNAIHQCAKLPKEQWEHYLAWLFCLEYDQVQLPKPVQVIYLDIDPMAAQTLLTQRYEGDDRRKDLHERDLDYLLKCHAAADYCVQVQGWQRVVCTKGGLMRSRQEIHLDVLRIVERIL